MVAALPAWLAWSVVRPAPWDSRTLRVRFESVRYEGAGLIFTYSIENRVWRSLRLLPDQTEIQPVAAAGQFPPGHPTFRVPLFLEGHSTERLELKMELPGEPTSQLGYAIPEPQPGIPSSGAATRPPRPAPAAALPAPQPVGLEDWIDDVLRNLNGFELVNPSKDVRLTFPRGW